MSYLNKEDFSHLLEEVAQYMRILGENDFKVRAYEKAAYAIIASKAGLNEIAEGEVKIPGIGEGLKTQIQEFIKTGTLSVLKEFSQKVPEGIFEIMKVPGVGPKKAMQIHKELGVNTLGELEYACRENRLTGLRGFGEALQKKILTSIEEVKTNAGKMRLDTAMFRAQILQKEIQNFFDASVQIIPVGALGRHAEIVEEIEFLIIMDSKKEQSSRFKDVFFKKNQLEIFGIKINFYHGKFKDDSQCKAWVLDKMPSAEVLFWLCASSEIQEEIEKSFKKYKNWEHAWLEPEWIKYHREPDSSAYRYRLDGGVKGVFHCHTNYSDGKASLEEMVRTAQKQGYEYIGISDHSQSAFYAHGLKLDQIEEQQKILKNLQKKVSIRIFYGIESDILMDGALDYPKDILSKFDFIIGSVHSRFQMDEEAMTQRLVKALLNPHLTMWGHPTGRLLLGRRAYPLNWESCFKAAQKNKVAIELNANPHRLDIDWRMGEKLEKYNLKICINPDAHSVEGLEDTKYGEYMAEKAMLPKSQILNLMGVTEMEKYLWERKKRF